MASQQAELAQTQVHSHPGHVCRQLSGQSQAELAGWGMHRTLMCLQPDSELSTAVAWGWTCCRPAGECMSSSRASMLIVTKEAAWRAFVTARLARSLVVWPTAPSL